MEKKNKNKTSDIKNKKRINQLLYPSLIVFFIFTFCESVLGVFRYFENQDLLGCIESVLIVLLWLILTIHIFSSFLRIQKVCVRIYPTSTFISECLEIVLVIGLVIMVESMIERNCDIFRLDYIPIYGMICVLIINQAFWFISLRMADRKAFFRIGTLLTAVIGLMIWEICVPSIWNHILFIVLFIMITIHSVIDEKDTLPRKTISSSAE
ncbi:MAG: hypothetical protein IJY36_06650 [Coprobacter sp.]|nr:hypothetical protein [Coprobacter sp.]